MLLLPIIVDAYWVAPFEHPSFNHDSRNSMLGMHMYIPVQTCASPNLQMMTMWTLHCVSSCSFCWRQWVQRSFPQQSLLEMPRHSDNIPDKVPAWGNCICMHIVASWFPCFPHFSILQATKSGGGMGMRLHCPILSPHLNTCNSTGQVAIIFVARK